MAVTSLFALTRAVKYQDLCFNYYLYSCSSSEPCLYIRAPLHLTALPQKKLKFKMEHRKWTQKETRGTGKRMPCIQEQQHKEQEGGFVCKARPGQDQ